MEKLTYYLTPFVIFFVFRIVMCFIELKRNENERVKKGVFHGVKHIYTEIGLFCGAAIGGILILLLPKLWYVFAVISIGLCYIGFKLGRKRGIAFDNMLRQVALEMQKMETTELTGEEHPAIAETSACDAADDAAAQSSEVCKEDTEETAPAEDAQEGENE